MAPELVAGVLREIPAGARVLDPMMGSGTFPLAAGRAGLRAIGMDTDPLAVVIARTGKCHWDTDRVIDTARAVTREARIRGAGWSRHEDPETNVFIDYWFDPDAKARLSALAIAIEATPVEVRDPLWVAFSRLIVTKDAGVSRARDVSHSRPHRVREWASFDPVERFEQSLRTVLTRALSYGASSSGGRVEVLRADARNLPLANESVGAIMTSPPYLTAIDYLRGHRMSLVWMGYRVSQLRALRAQNIGAESGVGEIGALMTVLDAYSKLDLPSRSMGILRRYARDLSVVVTEATRVLEPGGRATFVVADATTQGHVVDIASIIQSLADLNGLQIGASYVRELPADRRYLPLPAAGTGNALAKRMRTESILTLVKP